MSTQHCWLRRPQQHADQRASPPVCLESFQRRQDQPSPGALDSSPRRNVFRGALFRSAVL